MQKQTRGQAGVWFVSPKVLVCKNKFGVSEACVAEEGNVK